MGMPLGTQASNSNYGVTKSIKAANSKVWGNFIGEVPLFGAQTTF